MHDDLLKLILNNIESDREKAEELLEIALEYIHGNAANVERAGAPSAKYLEALQRSNDQLIKVFNLVIKETPKEEELDFDDALKDKLFEEIKNAKKQ